ncbi:MAG: hypothetical protein ACKO1X_09185 [Acidimicrobiales bacterium]
MAWRPLPAVVSTAPPKMNAGRPIALLSSPSRTLCMSMRQRRSNNGMVIFAFSLAVLLAMLGGRPVFSGLRRRRDAAR